MQQEINRKEAELIIQKKRTDLEYNSSDDELQKEIPGRQGILQKYGDREYKFLNLDNPLTLNQLQGMNQNEFQHLQILASSDYTCEVQENKCDTNHFLWITTAYMNQGNLDMDYNYTLDQNGDLDLETISIICKRLLNILNYFHQKRIFHLDVHPTNILLHEEFQFCYDRQDNHPELPIEQGLQRLQDYLRKEQQKPFVEQQVTPDYTNLQYILKLQQPGQQQSFPLIGNRLANEHVAELLYWIKRWFRLQNMTTFNPKCIKVKKGIRICFCDFGQSKQFEEYDTQRPIFEDTLYKTPYKILGKIVNQEEQIEAWKIARQQDLFCLGKTMMNLLMNNKFQKIRLYELNEENLGRLQNFFQQTYQLENFPINNISKDDQKELLKYQSFLNWLEEHMKNNQTFQLIYHMLSFRFTQNDIVLHDQRNQDIPLEKIWKVSKCRREHIQDPKL